MSEIVKYEHHGRQVSVIAEVKGKNREHCLCWQGCKFFKPGTPENCKVAQENYEFDVKNDMVTPVYECPLFEKVETII